MGDIEKKPDRTTDIKRVFLVDDEPLVLSALSRRMRQEGFEAQCFPSPDALLAALEKSQPDCIISDYHMPSTDGVSLLTEVKDKYPSVARVLLTGSSIDSRVRTALREKTIQVLASKPWHMDTIRNVISQVQTADGNAIVESQTSQPRSGGSKPITCEPEPAFVGQESKPTVLVVDDDPAFLRLMESWLARLGYQPLTAPAARPALDKVQEIEPDVMLVDLILPGMSGLELLNLLRDLFPKTPIVAITGMRERDVLLKAFQQGATVFLHKPLEPETLEATLRRCLQLGSQFFCGSTRDELASLLELQHAIASGMSSSSLLHLLLQEMLRYTKGDAASVLLVEPSGRTMRIAASYGLDERVVREERVGVGERISGWVVAHNEPQLVLGDSSDDPRLQTTTPRERPASVGMCIPMRGRNRVLGAVCVTRYHGDEPFTRDAVDFGLLLAGEVGRALERAAAVEEQINLERSLMRQDKLVTIGELASGVAHEINNPLGYVSSNLASLKEYLNDVLPMLQEMVLSNSSENLTTAYEKIKELDLNFIVSDLPVCLNETMEGVERVLKIVADLKNFARDDEQEMEPGDINQILDSAVNILWNQLKYKGELVKDYAKLPTLLCHPSRLGQVFLNLIHNAIQAIEQDGRIILRTAAEGAQLSITVEDNGNGMKPDVLERIFDPFFTTKPRGVGTGLGLSIARKIIDLHEGSLRVESEPGKGTTFRVLLPLRTRA